jgi:hypothetical protein
MLVLNQITLGALGLFDLSGAGEEIPDVGSLLIMFFFLFFIFFRNRYYSINSC